jgi:hypothetical protein
MITDALQDALDDRRSGGADDAFVSQISQGLPSHLSDLLRGFCATHGDLGTKELMDQSWLRNRMDPGREAAATSLMAAPLVPIAETSPLPTRNGDGPRRRPEGIHTSCCCIL